MTTDRQKSELRDIHSKVLLALTPLFDNYITNEAPIKQLQEASDAILKLLKQGK